MRRSTTSSRLLTAEADPPRKTIPNWGELQQAPSLDRKAQPGWAPLRQVGPKQEAELATLDKEFMKEAPWVPYGNRSALDVRRRAKSKLENTSSSRRPSPRTSRASSSSRPSWSVPRIKAPVHRLSEGCGPQSVLAIGLAGASSLALVVFVLAAPLWAETSAHTGPTAPTPWRTSKSKAKSRKSSARAETRSARSGSAPAASSSSAPTDRLGRDEMVRLMYAGRTSL